MIGLKAIVGRALQWMYHALPLSWEMRLTIKDAVFSAFAPILGRTNAYRRWQNHKQMRRILEREQTGQAELSVQAGETVVSAVDTSYAGRAERYVAQALALATERSPE